ncbi:NADP-dependent oxidoreductase [Streptomyces drozdowiczii]|uniref:NADP-dependent oxidoreductase n=1 Tax=Streptomyces drozdowiczii TaxID=202862 RepID=A0ABY6PNB8_9ACTN|nr:NADP-dependent oxidoreductase [Streptomyces drozdowiczii]MCX0247337.1 NADP-dependent oxidoreductase [Streptomyces drozdowiczii]UZK53256.1 NADP-dependent oxidoreductase [Streptomyces drozdowiczii]
MRAITQNTYGGPEVLTETEAPAPEPGVGEIRVRVAAAGVNPTDWKHRDGTIPYDHGLPATTGWDVAGTVDKVGPGVTIFDQGDAVFGMLPYPYEPGGYAEYATGPARSFAAKPDSIDFTQAAALPLASLTAWQALNDTARLTRGQRVLIQGGAGGVGHLAVQIARHLGAEVIATASADDAEFVRSLGADQVFDYRTTTIGDVLTDADAALVPLTGQPRLDSLRALRRGGILVSLLGADDEALALAGERGVRYRSMMVQSDHAGMRAIADMAATGALRVKVHSTLPLSSAAEAHRLGESGGIDGKLVLIP